MCIHTVQKVSGTISIRNVFVSLCAKQAAAGGRKQKQSPANSI